MKGFLRIFILLLTFGLMFAACKKDELVPNSDPVTSIFLSKIERFGQDRLNTIVTMHWSGEDKDGYVVGYEISFDNLNWKFTTKQDTIFRFSISSGSDTADVNFYVRAIDNDGNKDKNPAYLRIPIKNTAPTIDLDRKLIKTDTIYSVFSVLWNAKDLDGFETIDSIYIRLNTGDWFPLSRNISFVTIVPENPENAGTGNAKIYQGYEAALLNGRITGLNVDAANSVYVKVKDLSGAESKIDTLAPFFLKRKTSDLLVLDAHNLSAPNDPNPYYLPAITASYGSYDYYNFYKLGTTYIPALWKPTFNLYLKLYDKLVWYSDNVALNNEGMIIESASAAIQDYLNNNGKLFMISDFANNAYPLSFNKTSAVFVYSPMDSFQTFYSANQKATMPTDSLAIPDAVNAIGYPTLKASSFMDAVDPFFPKANAKVLYRAQIRRTNGTTNTRTIAAKTENGNGKTNQVFCSVDLYKMLGDADGNGQQDELEKLFRKVLVDEFNW